MAKKVMAYSRQAVDAAAVLGAQVAQARRARGWTTAHLAERVGVSPQTVFAIERGATTVAIGTVFEAATVLGVSLFGAEGPQLAELARRERQVVALLPRRVVTSEGVVDDGF